MASLSTPKAETDIAGIAMRPREAVADQDSGP
jgi:hypothetical protein